MITVKCTHCGEPVEKEANQLKHYRNPFCNSSCAARYNNNIDRAPKRRKKGEFRSCLNCPKEIYISKADIEKTKKGITSVRTNGKYCSNKCQREHDFKQKVLLYESQGRTPEALEHLQGKANSSQDRFLKKYLIYRYPHGSTGEACWHCPEERKNEWTGNVITKINHMDGNPNNQNLSNLELICYNCDALSEFYARRGKGGRKDANGNLIKR